MRCKHHPNRESKHFCVSCKIPICNDCAEEVKPGEHACFQCAMLASLSRGSTTLREKRARLGRGNGKEKVRKGSTPFRYFSAVSSLLIVVMWSVIIFGGQTPPGGATDYAGQPRVLLFLVDAAIKRYAHSEGSIFPPRLSDLIPKYLKMKDEDLSFLDGLSYERDSNMGYRLSLANIRPGEMDIVITTKGIVSSSPHGGEI